MHEISPSIQQYLLPQAESTGNLNTEDWLKSTENITFSAYIDTSHMTVVGVEGTFPRIVRVNGPSL